VIKFVLSPFRFISCVCLFVAGVAHFQMYRFFQPDDTFIFLVYAKNLLQGNGLTFNGEVVEGFSSLSWTLIISLLGRLFTADLLEVAKLASGLAYIGLAFMLPALMKYCRHTTIWLDATIVAALFCTMPPLAIWAASGMETSLFSLLLTAAVINYVIEPSATAAVRRGVLSGLLFGMLAITRPEGCALIAIPCCYELARLLLMRTVNWKMLLTTLLIFGCVMLFLLLWRITCFGELLPTTVHAKTGNLRLQLVNGINYVKEFCVEYFYLVAAYALACIFLLFQNDVKIRQFALISMITVFGYLIFIVMAGGDWMISYRLIAPILPIAVMTIGLAISFCKTIPIKMLLSTPLLVLALADSRTLYSIAGQQADSDRGDIIMGKYIHNLNLPAETKIAVIDAGAIPYFSGLPTIDMIGLNNGHIANLPGGFFQKFDNSYVLAQKPGIIQMHTMQRPSGIYVPAPVFVGTMQLFYSDEFQKHYEIDSKAPIQHLFKRRETALTKSMMDSFHDFSATLIHKDEVDVIRITKTGEGIWVAAPVQQLGSVHIAYRVEDKEGAVLWQDVAALISDLKQQENFEISLPKQALAAASRIVIDPVLVGVAQFSNRGKSVAIAIVN